MHLITVSWVESILLSHLAILPIDKFSLVRPRVWGEELPCGKSQDLCQASLLFSPASKQQAPLLFFPPCSRVVAWSPGQASHLYPVTSYINGLRATLPTGHLFWIHKQDEGNSPLKFSLSPLILQCFPGKSLMKKGTECSVIINKKEFIFPLAIFSFVSGNSREHQG